MSDQAQPWLLLASDRSLPLHRRTAHLRQSLTAARTHLVLEQASLRERAREKFNPCEGLFLTPVGLQQATDQWVGSHKATRFALQDNIADLCCGIGGDLMALSKVGDVVGYDRDPVAAVFASANLCRIRDDVSRVARASYADIRSVDLTAYSAWHIDPDRRVTGRRTVDPAQMSPSCEIVDQLLARNENGAVKLAPATAPPAGWYERAELEWISRGRECRQLVAWFGRLAGCPGLRRATILSVGGSVTGQVTGPRISLPNPSTTVRDYVYEPDPAVLAAGLAGHVAQTHALRPLAASIPYFTADSRISDAALAAYRVEAVLPFDEKRLASTLRNMRVGQVEIKHRGVRLTPPRLRARLRLSGEGSAVVIVSPHCGRNTAIIATRACGANAAGIV